MKRILGAACVLGLVGCASAPPPQVLTPERCAELAADPAPDGRTREAVFDSVYALAQSKGGMKGVVVLGDTIGKEGLSADPYLLNKNHVAQVMQRNYPAHLEQQGKGGKTEIAFLIRPNGVPSPIRLLRSSGILELDFATINSAKEMRFSPGRYHNCPVHTIVYMPVTWESGRPATHGIQWPDMPSRP